MAAATVQLAAAAAPAAIVSTAADKLLVLYRATRFCKLHYGIKIGAKCAVVGSLKRGVM